jgi:hypothetical protein
MATSSNGWTAAPDLPIRPLVVAGESFSPGVRDNADVYTVLRYVAEQLHERVEPIVRADWHQADDWGFSYRANVNSPNSLSNHASGTAFDYNATRHPNGVPASRNFTTAQIATIRRILAEVGGAVRWGGDFNGTPDAMHFEINVSPAALAPVARRIREQEWSDMATKAEIAEVVANQLTPVAARVETLVERTEGLRVTLSQLADDLTTIEAAIPSLATKELVRKTRDQVIQALSFPGESS